MKRFLIKSCIFFALVYGSTFIYIEYFAMSFAYMDYPIYKEKIDYIASGSGTAGPEILILGDSRSLTGIDPKIISDRAQSIGLTGGTSITTYYALKHYLEMYPAPRTIILSISPLLFEQHPEFYSRAVKYRLLTTGDAIEVLKRAHELKDFPFEMTPANGNYYWELFLYKSNYLLYYKSEILAGGFYRMWHTNHEIYATLEKNAGFWGPSFSAPSHGLNIEAHRTEFVRSPLLKDYFEKILDLCREKRIRVFFQAAPMNETSFKALKPAYVLGYRDFMSGIRQKYRDSDIEMNFELFSYPDEYFGDPSHLNVKGAELFSELVKKLI